MSHNLLLTELLKTCEFIAHKGLSPATAGNFSARIDEKHMLVSASGKDKSNLQQQDFLTSDLQANKISGEGSLSAEAFLHGMIYQLSATTTCVLHTHSSATTVLSMLRKSDSIIRFHGYEMQKTIAGCVSHEENLDLYIFDNDQDIPRLSQSVKECWRQISKAQGLIVRGHGLYSWGNSVFEAKRHMEGLEFLIECELVKSRVA